MPTARPERRDLLRAAVGATSVLPAALTGCGTAAAVRSEALAARDFGVRFDGRLDDAPALQRGIDEAARTGRSLALPSGTARLSQPLDLKGRRLALLGDPAGYTVLQAGGRLPCLLDADEPREVIDSPLYLYGLTLDGAGLAHAGLRLRYRHRTVFDTLAVSGCATGIDEIDSWLGRRINCRVRATGTGWRLRGANHSSIWLGCSFTDARDIHLDIGSAGTAQDGNDALLFQGCDVEYGAGHGIRIADGATVTFDTCYLGEGIEGDVLRSAGAVTVRGGALFVGHRVRQTAVVPLGGTVTVTDTAIRGQEFGTLARLVGADPSSPLAGKALFRDVAMQLRIGGDPVFAGDVLGTMPIRVFAPVLGRNWQATANDTGIVETAGGDERSVRCREVAGANPLIGLATPFRAGNEARRGGAAYLVLVYQASRPVECKFTSGAMSRAPWRLIGTLPATRGVATYVKVDVPVDFAGFSAVELIMPAEVGDTLTLHHATVSDASILEPGPLANLARAR